MIIPPLIKVGIPQFSLLLSIRVNLNKIVRWFSCILSCPSRIFLSCSKICNFSVSVSILVVFDLDLGLELVACLPTLRNGLFIGELETDSRLLSRSLLFLCPDFDI